MINKKIFFIFALVFLASLPFLLADYIGTCGCESGYDSAASQYVCTTNAVIYGDDGNACSSVSGFDACGPGYKPQCGNADMPLSVCNQLGYDGSVCGGCSCISTTYPYGNTCYDFLDTIGLDGSCALSTNPPAMNISKVNLTEEIGFGEGWNSYYIGIYGDLYCYWEDNSDASRCVACPQGMKWDENLNSCVCGPACSEPASCLSSAEEKKCIVNPSGCSVQQTKTCANSEYCGSSGSCAACPTSVGNGCASDACYGADPDCGCIPGNGACGAGCTYSTGDTDCETPHDVECAPLTCDGQTKTGCSDIDPDSLCT